MFEFMMKKVNKRYPMNKKCLAFYVSSHGFGHMTRCLAIMEELLETTEHLIYLASGTYQNSFARVYLARFGDRVTYSLDSQKIITWSGAQHLRCYIIATASS